MSLGQGTEGQTSGINVGEEKVVLFVGRVAEGCGVWEIFRHFAAWSPRFAEIGRKTGELTAILAGSPLLRNEFARMFRRKE